MLDKIEQMICFAAVCEAGTMTAASKILGCSKGHVSRTITALEKRIKTKLFHRSTRKLVLTDSGLSLKHEAVQLYRNALLTEKKSTHLQQQVSGQFVITAPVTLATYLLAPVIPVLQKTFPEIDFEIIATNESLNLINEGIDLAIRTGTVVDEQLIAHQIGVAKDVFYAHSDLCTQENQLQSLDDLHRHKVLLNPHSMSGELVRLYNGKLSRDWQPTQKTNISLYSLLLDLVDSEKGVGFAPNYCLAKLKDSQQVKHILSAWYGKEWPVFIVYPFHSPIPEKLMRISQFLKHELSAYF